MIKSFERNIVFKEGSTKNDVTALGVSKVLLQLYWGLNDKKFNDEGGGQGCLKLFNIAWRH
jgi:hypothetical protein